MEYAARRLNIEDFKNVIRKWTIPGFTMDLLMHLGAFSAIYLMIIDGFHIPGLFRNAPNFWLTFAAFIGLFFVGLHILGTVFPDHYMKGKPLRYEGVFMGILLYLGGLTGAFFVFVSALPGFSFWMWVLFYVSFWINILGITIGYHRLPTHRTFKCRKNFMRMLLGAGSIARQNDADRWGRNHLIHHERTEIEAQDPHTPRENFFHAHIGWIWRGYTYPPSIWELKQFSRGLKDDPLVQEQKKYYNFVMIGGFALPALLFGLIGLWSGEEPSAINALQDAVKAFLLCGLLRFVICYNITLSVNSWSHKWGPKPFAGRNTGDSTDPWYLAFFSSGENLQNIHHLMDFLACYWIDRRHPDFSGAIIVALERLGRFKYLAWAGLPYDLETLSGNPNRLKFMLEHMRT